MADDAIVAQYIVKTDAAVAEMRKLAAQVNALEAASKKSAKGSEDAFAKMSQNVSNQFKALGTTMAAAFTIDRAIDLGKEMVTLAAKTEGVERAFKRIGSPELLDGLRKATKGTVSDLNLMTASVRASNFKIPLEQMGTLLEFARRRAAETGESVDYLVESIVVGIGRKSPLILDNLGISAIELRKRFNGISVEAAEVGDVAKIVGDIATEELQKMGADAETTAVRLAQITAEFDNMKVAGGAALINIGDLLISAASGADDLAVKLGQIMARPSDDMIEALDKINAAFNDKSIPAAIAARNKAVQDLTDALIKQEQIEARGQEAPSSLVKRISELETLQNAYDEYIEKRKRAAASGYDDALTPEQAAALAARSEAIKEEIRNVFFLTEAIKALKEEQSDQATSVERVKSITQELIPLQAELDALLGKQKEAADNSAKALKELKERLADVTEITARGIEGLRQFAVDGAGINNSLNTLNESLAQARAQRNAAPIGSSVFDQAKKDVEELEATIKRIQEGDKIDPSKGYVGITSGIAEQAASDLEARIKAEQDYLDYLETSRNEALDILNAYASASMDIVARMNAYEAAITEQRYADIERLVKEGVITEEEADKKRRRIAREQAKRNKEIAIFQTVVNTAMAVVNALATAPNFIVGAIMAAAAGVLGGIEIATIEATPLPSFGKGGWIEGKKHTEGGVKLEAEGGEFIVNAKAASKYAGLLEDINADNMRGWDGLAESVALNNLTATLNDMNLLSAIDRHRESETRVLRELLHEVRRGNGGLRRGGYHA